MQRSIPNNMAREAESGDTSFDAIPAKTQFAKDRPVGPDITFFDNAVDGVRNNRMMESVGALQEPGAFEQGLQLTAPDVKAIEDFVAGRTAEPPQIPGLSPQSQLPNQLDPFGRPATYQHTLSSLGGPAPTPVVQAQAPAQPAVDYSAMLRPLVEQQQQAMQALVAPLQAQAQQQQQLVNQLIQNQQVFMQQHEPQLRARELEKAGYDPQNPLAQHLYDMHQRNTQMEQQMYALQQNLAYIQQQAHETVSRSSMQDKIRSHIEDKFPNREIPRATVEHAARLAVSLAPQLGEQAAFANALAGVLPLLGMIPEKTKKSAAQNPGPTTQPQLHPGMAALGQLPQFQGATQQQLAAAFQAMQAASMQGAGAGRNPLQPASLKTLESVLFN